MSQIIQEIFCPSDIWITFWQLKYQKLPFWHFCGLWILKLVLKNCQVSTKWILFMFVYQVINNDFHKIWEAEKLWIVTWYAASIESWNSKSIKIVSNWCVHKKIEHLLVSWESLLISFNMLKKFYGQVSRIIFTDNFHSFTDKFHIFNPQHMIFHNFRQYSNSHLFWHLTRPFCRSLIT